jgi:hypothetical protein
VRWGRVGVVGVPVLIVLILLGVYVLGPMWRPDYKKGNLKRVFSYTLLTDQFNRLPVEERLRLLGQLVERLKGISAGDSALMAAFAAGIAGSAREQLEKNASRLAIDVWDKYAIDYKDVEATDRDAFLDRAFVEFTKLMEAVGGRVREISDAERLAEGRRQARADVEMMKERGVRAEGVVNMLNFLQENVVVHASPQEQNRGLLMMRDMTLRLRGASVNGPR